MKKIYKYEMNKYQEEYCLKNGLVSINAENTPLSEYIEYLESKLAQSEQLILPDVSITLPNEVKCMLIESEYRLQQAIDIFNGTTRLDSTDEDKYLRMVDCANKINEYLKGN